MSNLIICAGDFIRLDGEVRRVARVIEEDGSQATYEMEDGSMIGLHEVTINDVLLESEVIV